MFQFCTVDLSSVYFDIRKDVLYCDADDSVARHAARTVLDMLFTRLTTWLAPMLTFTMEDVWLERHASDDASVHLEDFPETPSDWLNAGLAAKWGEIRDVRRVVTGAIEIERQEKNIGASLEAAPVVYVADAALRELLASVDFADACITSTIKVSGDKAPSGAFTLEDVAGVAVVFAKAEGEKCGRCWKILPDVGSHKHAQTCGRCSDALG